MNSFQFAESVTQGHPDKVADQIADALVDAHLRSDPEARVGIEVMVKGQRCIIAGEVRSTASVDFSAVARAVIRDIGYDDASLGFDADTCTIEVAVDQQSPEISSAVDAAGNKPLGAGDQGLVFGYASDETSTMMPLPIMLAHAITSALTSARKSSDLWWLRPDGKCMVTVRYEDGVPRLIDSVVVAAQHQPNVSAPALRAALHELVMTLLPSELIGNATKVLINAAGSFVLGGPAADAGVTGRKLMVDAYGGACRHGGGAFSGKDPTKIDRSAAYMARYVAMGLVRSLFVRRCEVRLAYRIGEAEPVAIDVEDFGTATIPRDHLAWLVRADELLTPASIREQLGLAEPIYQRTASGGHFGRPEFPWEQDRTLTGGQ